MIDHLQSYGPVAIAGVVLLIGVAVALRASGVRKGPRKRRSEPAPIAGGAEGLLESIPMLERVRRGRVRTSGKLAMAIVALAALLAAVLYGIGRAAGGALSHLIK